MTEVAAVLFLVVLAFIVGLRVGVYFLTSATPDVIVRSSRETDKAIVATAEAFEALHWALLPVIKNEAELREQMVKAKAELNSLRGAAQRRLDEPDEWDRFREHHDD